MNNLHGERLERSSRAPYSSISKPTTRKKSLVSQIRAFFNGGNLTSENSVNLVPPPSFAPNRTPGSFFSESSSDLLVNKRRARQSEQEAKEIEAENLDEANSSNSALAAFFREKGDAPLSEVEYEGVLSLMKKNRTCSDDLTGEKEDASGVFSAKEMKPALLRPADAVRTTSFKAPSFVPQYDDYSTTFSTSMRSTSSASSRKSRVFDYSNLPSPYRSCSYKHSAAEVVSSPKRLKSSCEQASEAQSSSNQKLSNTASALISLLDGDKTKPPASGLANPYTNKISEFKHEKRTADSRASEPYTPSKGDTDKFAQSIALSEIENNEEKDKERGEKHSTAEHFAKYKPVKASSLRTIVSAPKSTDIRSSGKETLRSAPTISESVTFEIPSTNHMVVTSENNTGQLTSKPFGGMNCKIDSKEDLSNGSVVQEDTQLALERQTGPKTDPALLSDSNTSVGATSQKVIFGSNGNPSVHDLKKSTLNQEMSKAKRSTAPTYKFDFDAPPYSGVNQSSLNTRLVHSLISSFTFDSDV
ncbi:LADA_0C04984g1_1 [Lachancea dasiensis]|uniref:LADA_0C04984g1_1 n=1 Tax=Lachancea dasiensis TaxID=1072105 RepID=A0A1G4IYU7_9SACH|nr:LADA_0C04984g1_1 [Lachancea dasiensis]